MHYAYLQSKQSYEEETNVDFLDIYFCEQLTFL